jgi:hypothetical protein
LCDQLLGQFVIELVQSASICVHLRLIIG